MNRSKRLLALAAIALLGAAFGAYQAGHQRTPTPEQMREMAEAVRQGVPWNGTVDLVMFGDWGYGKRSAHYAVARQMEDYAAQQRVRFDAVFLLGDNFYRKIPEGTHDPRWLAEFQRPFANVKTFAMPFYVAMGNHDYTADKLPTQLAYTKEDPTGRWTAPGKWHAVKFPTNEPLVTVVVIDSNLGRLSAEERERQRAWLKQTLEEARDCPWLILAGHHPLFSSGKMRENVALIEYCGSMFERAGVDFYVCGHDHGLQHLQVTNCAASLLVSGGGGAKLQQMSWNDRVPFSRAQHGFLHLHLATNEAVARFVSVEGTILHEFTRDICGHVKLAINGGRDEPSVTAAHEDEDD